MNWQERTDAKNPLTVIDLTRAVKNQLQRNFASIWVTGEISGFSQPRSGHCYLTLKDDQAQINAIIWRNTAERLKFEIENGQDVLCFGSLDIYPQRGTYQLIIERIEPRGVGSLELAFRQLHAKLQREGLFDPARKRQLPTFPKRIAVVTSPTGAAIRDFLQVLQRRWRNIEVIIIPAKVQGPGSANQIAHGINVCQRFSNPPEVIVITRGGGSKEDLWSFNEEIVCRAIANSTIPVLSGVGHEIDVTLSDLTADVRALTPSEAAERLVPDRTDVLASLQSAYRSMQNSLIGKLRNARTELEGIARRPSLTRPWEKLQRLESELDNFEERLNASIRKRLSDSQLDLKEYSGRLESLNPVSVLARGYSLTTLPDGTLVRNSEQLSQGSEIKTRLHSGTVTSRIEKLEP